MRTINFRPCLFIALALLAIAGGCSNADNILAPTAEPAFDSGWGYGSGG